MWRFWLSFLLFVLAVPLIPFALFGELPGESWIAHPDPVYVFLMGIVLLGSDIFLPIPSSLIALFMGARLGFEIGAAAIALGLTFGAVIGYTSGWYLGHPLVRRHVSENQQQIIRDLEGRFSYLALAMMRAVPVLAEASVLAAGAARLKPRPVFATLVTANISLGVLYAGIGSLSQESLSVSLMFLGGIGVPVFGILVVYSVRRLLYTLKGERTS